MWYPLARAALFRLDPETAHHFTLNSLALAEKAGLLGVLPAVPEQPVELLGLTFRNPVGLSAGLDKNGDYIDALAPNSAFLLANPTAVPLYHANGHDVHAWTVDAPAQIDLLLAMGVDGIFTDRPDTLKDVLVERGLWS